VQIEQKVFYEQSQNASGRGESNEVRLSLQKSMIGRSEEVRFV
jgi:hypothetical protein